MMLEDFDRAGEQSFRFGFSWSGQERGHDAWSGFASVVMGWNLVDEQTGQALTKVTEYDLTVDYKPASGAARGLWFRLRGAYADFDDGTERWNGRVILNYPFNLL